jgi:anti-sigma factor RsiW
MNCHRLRENLHDYFDNALSHSEMAAAQKHLAGCAACRAAVEQEQQLAQSLSRQFEQTAATISLDASARRRMALAIRQELVGPAPRPSFTFWTRFALPFAAAAVLVATIFIRHHPAALPDLPAGNARANQDVIVHATYSVPVYTFHEEGNLVVDALTSDTRVVDSTLLAKN